jgi:hypothetical protein
MHCRLTACVQAGMRRQLNKSASQARKRQQLEDKRRLLVEEKYKRAQLVSLDLLNADRSSLNVNQWGLISNITHIYDVLFEEHKQKLIHFQMHDEQKPVKLRLKISKYQQLAATCFTFIVPFLERIPDYQTLELSNRLTLIHHNTTTLTGIHSHYMISVTEFLPYYNKNYVPIMNMIYGNELVFENEKLRQKSDSIFHTDLFLVKLVLVIFAFSNVTPCLSYTFNPTSKSMNDEMMFSKTLFQIQNTYVDVLWRYMLFRFRDENLVVRLYSHIIYNCLHVQTFSNQVAEQNDLHKDMYDGFIELLEAKLNLQEKV